MTNKTKKRARALAESSGISYQAALNAIRSKGMIDNLIESLNAEHISSILVGMSEPSGGSASLHVEREQLAEMASNPTYYAETSSLDTTITREQMEALIARGATSEHGLQRICLFKHDRPTLSFSVRCASCDRWISCPRTEAEGTCVCGQRFVVTFDGPVNWSLTQRRRCMECGCQWGFTEPHERRNPWTLHGTHQLLCNRCQGMPHEGRGPRVTPTPGTSAIPTVSDAIAILRLGPRSTFLLTSEFATVPVDVVEGAMEELERRVVVVSVEDEWTLRTEGEEIAIACGFVDAPLTDLVRDAQHRALRSD